MDAGADDYIVKPPNLNVLVARVNAHLRSSQGNQQQDKIVNYGELAVDFIKRKFELNSQAVKLSR